jgi:hypothetical protein
MALTIKIRADASHFKKTIAGIEVQASGLTGVMGKLATSQAAFGAALAAAAAGAVALGAGLAFIKDASTKAAGIESLTMQFETLLGSAERAKDRMEEIKEFAASTPFEVANLSETSKLLQTLGGDLLATGDGLRMVGDAASIAGQPIQEVGLHVGRLFNAITSGTSAGEAIARLQELGLMTGKVKLQFEALAAAQKKGEKPILTQTQAMTLLQGVFAKTAGAMERLSMTTEGKLSNMKDAVDNLKVSFGTGFNDGLKTALDATNSFLPQLEMKFSKAGELVGNAIKNSISGNHDMIAGVGAVLGETLMAGVRSAIKIGISSLIRDGIGGYVSLGGSITGNPETKVAGAAISSGIGSTLGPRESMADIIKGETDGIDRAVKALEKIANDQKAKMWDEQLRKQVAATEELVRQGRQSTGVGLYPTSR